MVVEHVIYPVHLGLIVFVVDLSDLRAREVARISLVHGDNVEIALVGIIKLLVECDVELIQVNLH